jgi:hypothetical protein
MVCLKVTVKITTGHIKVVFENSLMQKQFRVVSERNQKNQMSKELVHRYDADGHVRKMLMIVRKTYNFNSQFLHN